MSGLVGLSGTAPIVAGLIILGCSALEIVGTSVFILVGISLVGFLMHLLLGNVNWKLVLMLAIGTSSGASFAPYIWSKFRKESLEKFLPTVVIIPTVVMGLIAIFK